MLNNPQMARTPEQAEAKVRIMKFNKLVRDNPTDVKLVEAALSACANATANDDGTFNTAGEDNEFAFKSAMNLYNVCLWNIANTRNLDEKRKWVALAKSSLLYLAHKYFDSFMLYLEFDRRPDKRFYAPRRKQLKRIVDGFQDVADGKIDLLTVSQPKRTGKGGMPDDKILTPTGWTTYGQIKDGDKVICANGKITTVNGVFHRGKVPMYEVEFDGGCKTHCSFDHLWTVQTEEDRAHWGTNTRTMKFADMIPHFFRGGDKHSNYSVQYVKPIEFEHNSELPIKPWLLGAIIGDGTISQNDVRFSNMEQDVIERFARELPDSCRLVKSIAKNDDSRYDWRVNGIELMEKLSEIGLMGHHSYDKFIPKQYLFADVERRTELLRGLVDTDGHAICSGKKLSTNQIEYTTTSEQLAKDVEFLVRSLGGRITYKIKQGHYTKNGERIYTRKYYRMTISFANDFIPFSSNKHGKNYDVRRPVLRNYMRNYKYIGEQECICISIDDESGLYVTDDFIVTHNTTLGLMFVIWRAGLYPDKSCLLAGRGDSLVKSFYDECLNIMQDKATYNYWDVFPGCTIANTNADQKTIDLNSKKRFSSIVCKSLSGQMTGVVEASNILYIDDPVQDQLEARNIERLNTLWASVSDDCMGRRKEGVPIIAQGTRFSINDPIGRLQSIAPQMGWRVRIVEVPALDPVTDESNFHYKYGLGFSTEYYRNERKMLADIQWQSEYQQRPIEERGTVFSRNDLQYYDKLPDLEWDAILAVTDPSEGKGDNTCMIVAFVSGTEAYIEDVVFSNALPEYNAPKCGIMCVKYGVKICQIESNANGLLFAEKVEIQIKAMNGRTSVRTKRTTANKETKIIVASDNIRNHFWFKNPDYLDPASEYAQYLRNLWSYSQVSKNLTDDGPDCTAMMENMIGTLTANKVTAFKRPF